MSLVMTAVCGGLAMSRYAIRILLPCFVLIPLSLLAQDFKIDGREVQVHGFASQGFVHTGDNNWLTMQTSDFGSGEFTDFGVNASTQLTDKFRIGAQGYDRNLGALGKWHPSLDWGFADYRFRSWLGFRGGKVKTTVGLYNDTQDLDFLRVFILLPQSMYPTDLRDATIAHLGGDLYGTFALRRRFGSLSYTAYAGHRKDSDYSGYPYLLSQYGITFYNFGGLQYGGDLRWRTPINGLILGASRLDQDIKGNGIAINPVGLAPGVYPYTEHSKSDWTNQYYGSYAAGKLRIDSEYRRYIHDQYFFGSSSLSLDDVRGCYLAGSYRLHRRLEVGSYYSRYTISSIITGSVASSYVNQTDTSLPANHIYDKVISARVDLKQYWYLKIEGHFMNGNGASTYPDGFYPQENPAGFSNNTNALVLKTGLHF
jgi:hypothetical protein